MIFKVRIWKKEFLLEQYWLAIRKTVDNVKKAATGHMENSGNLSPYTWNLSWLQVDEEMQ